MSGSGSKKVLAILYPGQEDAKKEPRLLSTFENELGLRQYIESKGYTYEVRHSQADFEKEIVDAEVLITTPYHPINLTPDLVKKAEKLEACIVAGVGTDHLELFKQAKKPPSITEALWSNTSSSAEHVVMSILLLLKNYGPARVSVESGGWDLAKVARNAFDLEGKVVGTIGTGRIGLAVMRRLAPFNPGKQYYTDKLVRLDPDVEKQLNAEFVDWENWGALVSKCDIVTVNVPLIENNPNTGLGGTRGSINSALLNQFKKGAYLVSTSRGAVFKENDIADALKSGQLNGFAADSWNPSPPPTNHVWRTMKNPLGGGNGMVPHLSGFTLDSQKKCAELTKKVLEKYFNDKEGGKKPGKAGEV